MNKVELMGRLTKDVEMVQSKSGVVVAKITLAIPRKTNKDETDFIDAVAFGKLGETLSKYVTKGNRLIVTGSIQLNNYTDKDGNNRTSTTIIIDDFYFVDFKKAEEDKKDELPFG